jgi:hypothetical protein
MNGSAGSIYLDKATGKLRMFNKRAEWHWRMREALDPRSGIDLAIPPDPMIRADLAAARYELTARGIKIEDKDEIKKRIKRSPDKGEALMYAHAEDDNGIVLVAPIIVSSARSSGPGG